MKSITNITAQSFVGWHLEECLLTSLDILDEPFARGGYGRLYYINSPLLSSLQCKWVVKITQKSSGAVAKEGFRNMRELSQKIRDYQQVNYPDYQNFLIKYSPLIGFPQACFSGKLDDQDIYGYLMPDLQSLGFILFSDLLESEGMVGRYITGVYEPAEFERRARSVRLLAETFHLLQAKFKYIHGDVKAKSIWVKSESHLCALIDYDGGLFDLNRIQRLLKPGLNAVHPQIFGELQEWLAPEILKKVNEKSNEAQLEVSFESDRWSFAVGSFQILLGITPFLFLNELVYEALKNYNSTYTWPEVSDDNDLFRAGEVLSLFESMLTPLKQHIKIWQAFVSIFIRGILEKRERFECGKWSEFLSGSITKREPTVKVKVASPYILEGESATISWETSDAILKIDGSWKDNSGTLTHQWLSTPQLIAINEFGDWKIDVPLEIVSKPAVVICQMKQQRVKFGAIATIEWSCRNVHFIEVIRDGTNEWLNSSTYEFIPSKGERVEVVFYSKYKLATERVTLNPIVIEPVYADFESSRRFIAETLPVVLKWQTKNADSVELLNVNNHLEHSGELQFRPLQSTEYILIVKNEFFELRKSVYIEVLPVPKIGNISLPLPPDLRISVPRLDNNIPEIIDSGISIRAIIKKIFNEYDE